MCNLSVTVCSWDGRRLSSSDGSHVAFATRGCPSAQPYRIPLLRSVYTWKIDDVHAYDILLSQDGDRTGNLMHADFIGGWPEDHFPEWLSTCTENSGCTANPVSSRNLDFTPSSLGFSKQIPAAQTEGIQNL